jgi:hypothetical protein
VANLVLAFGEVLAAAILLDAAIKGDSIPNVVTGKATSHPLPGSDTTGGSSSTAGTVAAGSYTNPVPGATLSRTDEGVDYTLGSQGFLAPGRSQIVSTSAGWFRGGSITAKFLDGPYAGSEYFVAEGVKPAAGIAAGTIVQAGQKIADAIASPYNGIVGNIESGWWKGSAPLAQQTGGYHEGDVTAAGAAWDSFVRALGGIAHAADAGALGSVAGIGLGDL